MNRTFRGLRFRVRQAGAALAVAALTGTTLAALPALAYIQEPGYRIYNVENDGTILWLGALENLNDPKWLQWCIEMGKPTPEAKATTIASLAEVKELGQGEFKVTTPQMAWLLEKKEPIAQADSRAALSFLLHANYDLAGSGMVSKMINETKKQQPQVLDKARTYLAEARRSAAVGYENVTVQGDSKRSGSIGGIGVLNAEGQFLSGRDIRLTFDGPVIFKETGTNTWTGKSKAEPLTFEWEATGNGNARVAMQYKAERKTLTRYAADGTVQQTLSYGDRNQLTDPEWVDGGKADFKLVYDFQPIAVSNVGESKVIEGNTLSDTLTAKADPNYGHGEWIDIDGAPIPVTFEGTAYHTGDLPADEADAVPADAKPIATTSLTFAGAGTQTATVDVPEGIKPGFVTWVWTVTKDAHGENAKYIHANWSDRYGMADETTSNVFPVEVNTAINARLTKNGRYFHDDVWVTGFPENHGTWAGSHNFKADVKTLDQSLYFFHEDLEVTEANKPQAELIATTTIPAKNGFYPSVGGTKFKEKEGNPIGTYVFVTSFAGDDRVKPFTTSVEDKSEQFTVEPVPPTLKTTATDKKDGDKELDSHGTVTISDKVCYTDLRPGKEYSLSGVLMDKATGKPIMVEDKEVTASKTFTPAEKNGCEIVDFTLDAKHLQGKTTVVFETLYRDGKTVAVHADINDEGQTVPGPEAPALTSVATDKADGDKEMPSHGVATISDEVCYVNLVAGKEYTLSGVLMDKESAQPLMVEDKGVTSEVTFTAKEKNGCETVEFTLDASVMQGKNTVVFETLLSAGEVITTHTDINDPAQTVTGSGAPTLKTTATDQKDGDKILEAGKNATVSDKVCYTNLVPGREYELSGVLMDKATSKPLMVEGKEITTSKMFTAKEKDGCEIVEFTLDASALATKKTVVFERLMYEGLEVVAHADINDEGQTVEFKGADKDKGGSGRSLAKTGASVAGLTVGALALAGMGVGALTRKRPMKHAA